MPNTIGPSSSVPPWLQLDEDMAITHGGQVAWLQHLLKLATGNSEGLPGAAGEMKLNLEQFMSDLVPATRHLVRNLDPNLLAQVPGDQIEKAQKALEDLKTRLASDPP